MKEEHDAVNHPKHYTSHPSGIECIQITEHMGFNLGNALKYIWRADLKNDAIEDLKKARWYIDRELAKRETASQPTMLDVLAGWRHHTSGHCPVAHNVLVDIELREGTIHTCARAGAYDWSLTADEPHPGDIVRFRVR